MVQSPQFKQQVATAVAAKQAALDTRELPQLRERFDTYRVLYENVYNALRQKGQLEEDPYKNADQIPEVTVPPRDRYPQPARRVQMSNRFAALHTQLECVSGFYSFTTEFLDLARAATLGELVRYVDWAHLGAGAQDFMTAELGRAVDTVRSGNDNMSASILNDASRELAALTTQVIGELRALTAFHRQYYKLMLRTTVLDQVLADVDDGKRPDGERLVRQMKRRLAQTGSGRAFYPELAQEVLGEEIGNDVERARRKALASLAVREERTIGPDLNAARLLSLENAIRSVVAVAASLRSAAGKSVRNEAVMQSRKRSIGERLRRWLAKAANRAPAPKVYDVDFEDPATGAIRSERVNFAKFVVAIRRRVRVLAAAAEEGSPTYAKLQRADETSRADFLQHNLNDLRLLHRRASAPGAHFASTAAPAQKRSLQGIKIEMSAVKNGLAKAAQFQSE